MTVTRSLLAPSVVLLLASGVPAVAQRVEVATRRPRSEVLDTSSRRMHEQLDSLVTLYNDGDALTGADRRRIEVQLSRLVERMAEASGRGEMEVHIRTLPSLRAATPSPFGSGMAAQALTLRAMPRGWIGVVVEGPALDPRVDNGDLVIHYLSYPRIVTVDPSSPAQRAGIVPGDTLVSYNGVEVRDVDINMPKLLVPLSRVNVRVRRDGKLREFAVTVDSAPRRIGIRREDEARSPRDWTVIGVPDAPAFPRASGASMAPTPMAAMLAPRAQNMLTGLPTATAGMQLNTITPGLAKVIGVASGVLVTSAPAGLPANLSGVEDGDVIVRVSDQAVRTVRDVMVAFNRAADNGERAVELEIVRERKTQKLTLKW